MAENTEKFFKFIWKVDNFSYIWNEKDDFLRSPNFSLDVFEGSDWCLKLYPRGRSWYENCVSVYLERLTSSEGPLEIKICFKIVLLSRNGETEFGWGKSEQLFRRGSEHGFDSMVSRERLLGTKNSNLLPDDILTLQCCILPQHNELQISTEVIAKTHTEIECFVRQWKEIDYTADNLISFRKGYSRSVSLRLIVSKDSDNQAYVLSCQFHNAIDLKAFHGKISTLDSNNSVVECLVNQFFDIESAKEGAQCYLFFTLITLAELLKHKSRFLPNGKLNLYCELTLSYGLQHSQIERIAHDASFMCAPVEETASTSQIDVPAKRFLYCIDNIPSLLKNDFQNLLQEGTLSDFTIKVGDKNFQVHKAVLCARSPTFKAMLTRNMKENEENLVDISDLG
ncbi:hypothetical protein AVEN_88906-1 [Araneus ventricosus]|uniref:Speckle-type POZ protein n=1 Tax=Araneus ventricosus TaxID=182803 RepID=A0A4Y2STJ8_ARAVE|nr:hypothetical protein AVEN_88906-1 [Araneus ventricosus]